MKHNVHVRQEFSIPESNHIVIFYYIIFHVAKMAADVLLSNF